MYVVVVLRCVELGWVELSWGCVVLCSVGWNCSDGKTPWVSFKWILRTVQTVPNAGDICGARPCQHETTKGSPVVDLAVPRRRPRRRVWIDDDSVRSSFISWRDTTQTRQTVAYFLPFYLLLIPRTRYIYHTSGGCYHITLLYYCITVLYTYCRLYNY